MRTAILVGACFIAEALNPELWESYTIVIPFTIILIMCFAACDLYELFGSGNHG